LTNGHRRLPGGLPLDGSRRIRDDQDAALMN
jgi:hypothetical protein